MHNLIDNLFVTMLWIQIQSLEKDLKKKQKCNSILKKQNWLPQTKKWWN